LQQYTGQPLLMEWLQRAIVTDAALFSKVCIDAGADNELCLDQRRFTRARSFVLAPGEIGQEHSGARGED